MRVYGTTELYLKAYKLQWNKTSARQTVVRMQFCSWFREALCAGEFPIQGTAPFKWAFKYPKDSSENSGLIHEVPFITLFLQVTGLGNLNPFRHPCNFVQNPDSDVTSAIFISQILVTVLHMFHYFLFIRGASQK